MRSGLCFALTVEDNGINNFFNYLIFTVDPDDNPYTLFIANSIYMRLGQMFDEYFIQDVMKYYDGEAKTIDFKGRQVLSTKKPSGQ